MVESQAARSTAKAFSWPGPKHTKRGVVVGAGAGGAGGLGGKGGGLGGKGEGGPERALLGLGVSRSRD